ncbi:protein SCAI [Hyaloraphidium curvatum]|nr:protein SCAI [Hyaloraphidium curvatum]
MSDPIAHPLAPASDAPPDGPTASQPTRPPVLGSVVVIPPASEGGAGPPSAAPVMVDAPRELPVMDQASARLVEEFQSLLEKSQQLFAGLRDLPPTGGQKTWQPYFQRTFEVYTKLWKFQQQHRAVLENKDYYGLKRWEIGEIASKVAQLYYHFFLRTSETNYLHESFVFYEAIRDRQYFKDVMDSRNPALVIKKLRYYARYIVVCLLLNRHSLIKPAMEELSQHVDEYTRIFKPSDAAEWNLVITEISHFMEADRKVLPVSEQGQTLSAPQRLQGDRWGKADKEPGPRLRLQEAIVVGNNQNQVKFSELSLDMYRMLQSLEREPVLGARPTGPPAGDGGGAAPAREAGIDATGTGGDRDKNEGSEKNEDGKSQRRSNPHKYLLYRPTFGQLLLYLTAAFKEINDNSAMLLYMSADGAKRSSKLPESVEPFYGGGIATGTTARKADKPELAELQALYPGDVLPFTRKPLFLILDSSSSTAFRDFPRVFSQPVVALMSPTEYPANIVDSAQIGNLFTLFLHCPIKAFSLLCSFETLSSQTWDKCLALFTAIEDHIADLLARDDPAIDKAYRRFAQDDFLKQFIVRFIFFSALLPLHTAFDKPKYLPSSYPALPSALLSDSDLLAKIHEAVALADPSCFRKS